ncbi:MAG: hypothetical protein U5L09_13730 [Bacteroidales bacterium]|nr:hypothetical protein [Bacteroidales bacterium]
MRIKTITVLIAISMLWVWGNTVHAQEKSPVSLKTQKEVTNSLKEKFAEE